MKQKLLPKVQGILKSWWLPKNRKRTIAVAALLCFTVLLVGIPAIQGHLARYVDSDTDLAAVHKGNASKISKTENRRHTLVVATDELTGAMAPQNVQVLGDRIMNDLIYEPLGKMQTNGVIQPVLAKNVRVAEDGMSMDITLHSDIDFSDGTAMEPEHVLGSLALMVKHSDAGSPYRNIAGADAFLQDQSAGLSGVEALDQKMVRIHFEKPTSKNLELLDTRIQNVRLADLKSGKADGAMSLGTGPYCASDKPGDMTLVQNKHFRESFGDIQTVQFVYVSYYDLDDYLEKGQVDVFLYGGNSKAYEKLVKYPTYHTYEKPTEQVYYFGFNRKNPWMEKTEFRQAIAHGFHREKLVNKELFPYITENQTLSLSTDQYSKKSAKSVLSYDPKKAKELLSQANPEGDRITLRMPVLKSSSIQTTVAEAFRKDMDRIGLTIEIQPLSQDEYIDALYLSGKFDICLSTMQIPMEFAGMNELTGDQNSLPIGWEDADFSEALNELENCYQPKQYAEQLTELNRIANQGVPILPYGRGKMFLSVSADLSGYQANPYSSLLDHVWKIKVKK